jgi:hypothetical protein
MDTADRFRRSLGSFCEISSRHKEGRYPIAHDHGKTMESAWLIPMAAHGHGGPIPPLLGPCFCSRFLRGTRRGDIRSPMTMERQWKALGSSHWLCMDTADRFRRSLGSGFCGRYLRGTRRGDIRSPMTMERQWKALGPSHWLCMDTADRFRRSLGSGFCGRYLRGTRRGDIRSPMTMERQWKALGPSHWLCMDTAIMHRRSLKGNGLTRQPRTSYGSSSTLPSRSGASSRVIASWNASKENA